MVKNLPANPGDAGNVGLIPVLGRSPPHPAPEEEMATHSSILAWRIPWTGEPGRLQFMGSQRVGHNLETEQACSLLRRGKLTERQYGVVVKSV